MTIYEFKTSLTIQAGSASAITLNVIGGLLRSVYVKANTQSTVFRANLTDENGNQRIDYGFSTGMINDYSIAFPIVNRYTFSITNANPDNDTFAVVLGVQE